MKSFWHQWNLLALYVEHAFQSYEMLVKCIQTVGESSNFVSFKQHGGSVESCSGVVNETVNVCNVASKEKEILNTIEYSVSIAGIIVRYSVRLAGVMI